MNYPSHCNIQIPFNVFKKHCVNCIADDVVSEILPIRESVCFSGSVISLYQPHCVPFSMRNMSLC